MIKRYDIHGTGTICIEEFTNGDYIKYADHMAEVERIKSTYSKDEIEMAKVRAQELRLKLFPEIVFKEEFENLKKYVQRCDENNCFKLSENLSKLTEQNKAMKQLLVDINQLEIGMFKNVPDQITNVADKMRWLARECLKGLE